MRFQKNDIERRHNQPKNVKFRVGLDKIGAKIDVLISKRLGVVAKYEDEIYELKPIEWQKNSINSSDSVEMILARFSLLHFER